MNEMIVVGKTVSTHGIKGELKVISDFEYLDKAFIVGNKVLINNIEHTITSIRYHKQYILMGIDNIDDINNVLEYVGYNVYITRSDLKLNNNEYLLNDLVGMSIIDDGKCIGKVKEVVLGSNNNFIRVDGTKEFLIPLIPIYVKCVNIDNKEIETTGAITLSI